MIVNKSITAFQNLLDLIELSNPNPIVVGHDQVTVGALTVLDAGTGYNCEIVLNAVAGKGFTGSVTIRYNRMLLSAAIALDPTPVELAVDTTAAQAIDLIAEKYALINNEIEILGTFVKPFMTELLPQTYTIRADDPNSYVYTSDEVQVTVQWPNLAEAVHTAVNVTMPTYFSAFL